VKIISYINLMRPYQWLKNILLLAPVFFAGGIISESIIDVFAAIACFCLLSSIGYIFNDWMDRKRDSFHPYKKHRPICSGKVSGLESICLSVALFIATIIILLESTFPHLFFIMLLLYFLLTASYSVYIKHIVILEIFAVSMGFVLRVLAGGAVSSIIVSSWLFMTVFFISMLISIAKRLSEFNDLGKEKAILHRGSQNGYTISFLTNMLWACGGVTLVVYALYVVGHGGIVVYSVLPATYGIFRFIYLADMGKAGDPVKVLFTDIQLLATTLFFLVFIGITIYCI